MSSKGKVRQRARKLLFGIGINDADYVTRQRGYIIKDDGTKKRVETWRCPFFSTWSSMLRRCYSEKERLRSPAYSGCTVCEEWLTFSNFKAWMEQQDWEGKQLDKDILVINNRVYSPETCIFVENTVNSFVKVEEFATGVCLPGVYVHTTDGRFCARVAVGGGKLRHIGLFDSEEEAHMAWKREKYLLVMEMQDKLPEKVRISLLNRYS